MKRTNMVAISASYNSGKEQRHFLILKHSSAAESDISKAS